MSKCIIDELFFARTLFKYAYEVKNNFCLFKTPFKVQKNGVFLFEISFFVLEILMFSIMQIRSVMMSYCLQLKVENTE